MNYIEKNFFQLFELPRQYDVDLSLLSERYRNLQKQLHPDRFVSASDQERRLSVQYSAYVNQGLETLKSPLLRAQYLLELSGIDTNASHTMKSDPHFLMQQMLWREELSEIRDSDDPEVALDHFLDVVRQALKTIQNEFVAEFSSNELDTAQHTVDKMQFVVKLQREAEDLESELLDN